LGALQLSEYARRLEKQVSGSYTYMIESMINDIMTTSDKLKENATIFLSSRN
jgi:molecular chaperone GrpE (heat shock protein)